MVFEFEVSCLGYSVGGSTRFEIEIDDSELEGMSEDEKMDYIHKCCWEYTIANLGVEVDL